MTLFNVHFGRHHPTAPATPAAVCKAAELYLVLRESTERLEAIQKAAYERWYESFGQQKRAETALADLLAFQPCCWFNVGDSRVRRGTHDEAEAIVIEKGE